MKSTIIQGFALARAILLDVISDSGTACTFEPMGQDEYGLSVSDDKEFRQATALAAQKEDSTLGLLIAVYRSEADNLRVASFSDIDQAEAFLVKCACDDGLKVKDFEHLKKAELHRNIAADVFEGHTGQEFARL
jgi:hypothetical protein